MTTLKAIIQKNIPTTTTTAYLNASGQDAAMKAFNVNTIDPTIPSVGTSTDSDWTVLGGRGMLAEDPTYGFGRPAIVKLGADRLLLLWNNLYLGSGFRTASSANNYLPQANRLLCQIVELQSGKYVAGPITTLTLPDQPFYYYAGAMGYIASNNAAPLVQGVALSATKVAVVYFHLTTTTNPVLLNINITGNSVDKTFYSKQITELTNSAHVRIEIVPTNANKVVVTRQNSGTGALQLQAYNVTGTANPTAAGSVQNIAASGLSTTNLSHGLSLHRRSDNTYIAAGTASTTQANAYIFTFDDATNTITAVANNSLTGLELTQGGLVCCCASNGTDYKSYILNRSSASAVSSYPQTSGTTVSTSANGISTQSASGYPVMYAVNVTNTLPVVVGSMCIASPVDAAQMTSTTMQTDFANYPFIFPFATRPVYYFADNSSQKFKAYAKTGITTSLSSPTQLTTGNYVPWGIPTGRNYAWHNTAECWIIGSFSKLYAIQPDGTILGEVIAADDATTHGVKNVAISSTGVVWFLNDSYGVRASSGNSGIHDPMSVSVGDMRYGFTSPITTGAGLTTATISTAAFGTTSYNAKGALDLITYGTNNFFALIYAFNGSSYPRITYVSSQSSGLNLQESSFSGYAGSSGMYGLPDVVALKDSATTVRCIGMQSLDTSSSVTWGYTTTSVAFGGTMNNLGTMSTVVSVPAEQIAQYRYLLTAVTRSMSGMYSASFANFNTNNATTWVTKADDISLTAAAGVSKATSGNNIIIPIATSGEVLITYNNYTTGASAPFSELYVYTTATPYDTYTGTSGYGYTQPNIVNNVTLKTYGAGLNNTYTTIGTNPIKFTMSLNDGTNDFYITSPTGQTLTAQNNRCTDVYYVPNGYSVKIKCNYANVADAMLEVLEQ